MELRRLTQQEMDDRFHAQFPKEKKRFPTYVKLDCDKFEQLCKIQCTKDEIAAVLGVSPEAIERRVQDYYGWFAYVDGEATKYMNTPTYQEVWKKYAKDGSAALRSAQFRSALENKNVTMQIWLGKQMLNQKDFPVDATATDEVTVAFDVRKALYRKGLDARASSSPNL